MPRTRAKLDPVLTYYLLTAGDAFFFTMVMSVSIIFQTREAGLSPIELLLVGAALQGAILVSEMPTGIVADAFSRRLSVVIGLFLLGGGAVISGILPQFGTIIAGTFILGVGRTFVSGAQQAWIADEVGLDRANRVYLRTAQLTMALWVAAVPVSFALATQDLNLPIILGGALIAVLGAFLALTMPETGFTRPSVPDLTPAVQQMRDTYSAGLRLVRLRPLLITMLCITAFYGVAGQGFERLWVAQFNDTLGFPSRWDLDPLIWFGIARFGAAVLGVGTLEAARRLAANRMNNHVTVSRTLFAINALQLLSILALALAGSFEAGAIAYTVTFALSFTYDPFYLAWVNQNADSRVRATVLSMSSQSDALGRTLGGPLIGAVGSLASLRAALSVAAFALVPALLLYLRAFSQGTREVDTELDAESLRREGE